MATQRAQKRRVVGSGTVQFALQLALGALFLVALAAPKRRRPAKAMRQPYKVDTGSAITSARSARWRSIFRRTASGLLILLGLALVLSSMGMLFYSQYSGSQLSHIVPVVEAAPAPSYTVERLSEQVDNPAYRRLPLPPTRIIIPSIGLDSKVVELGTRLERGELVWDTASHAVGWYGSTALPGYGSNIVMSGHISSPLRGEGSIFRRLPEVAVGDFVVLETAATQRTYEVVDRDIVAPTEVEVMAPTPAERLTLITCYPDFIYSHRLVVIAEPR